MSWSTAEITTLAAQAARGAGAPPGQAARFGQVAAVHLTAARDPSDLERALRDLPQGAILTYPLALDRALTKAVKRGDPVRCDLPPGALAQSYVAALPFATELVWQTGAWALRVSPDPPARAAPRRITGCAALMALMKSHAAQILVPDSAASQATGAGAGLTDND